MHMPCWTVVLALAFLLMPPAYALAEESDVPWAVASERAEIFAQCAGNARQIVLGWLEHRRDPETHLYSRGRRWDWHNEAADHYSSLVLVGWCIEPEWIQPGGTLHTTLQNAKRLCVTPSGIPATYDLQTGTQGPSSVGRHAEWLRDGLIRIVEVLGTDNDWCREMVRLVDAILSAAPSRGGLARLAGGAEAQGNLLQTLARLYVMSGNQRYLEAAEELADTYLLDDPIAAVGRFHSGDHNCELVPGLAELFVVKSKLGRPKANAYRDSLRKLLDRILEVGRHPETGLWYRSVDLRTGAADTENLSPDTWGYVLFAYENFDQATGEGRYTEAIRKPMIWLTGHRPDYDHLKTTLWPRSSSMDDWSDSYESMIVLWNRRRDVPRAVEWLDWATHQGGHRRNRPDSPFGPGDGGHFDGSTARTLCLHAMLCSQGIRPVPCPDGLGLGAVPDGNGLAIVVRSDRPYRGKLCFDGPRNEYPTTTVDWARINEMPQWFVVRAEGGYRVQISDALPAFHRGEDLLGGLPVEVDAGGELRIAVRRDSSGRQDDR